MEQSKTSLANSKVRTSQTIKELELAAERLVEDLLEKAAQELVEGKMEMQVEAESEQVAVEKIVSDSLASEIPPAETSFTPQAGKAIKCRVHTPGYNEGPFVCRCFESGGTSHVAKKKRPVMENNIKQETCRIHGAKIYGSDYDDRPFICTCFDEIRFGNSREC